MVTQCNQFTERTQFDSLYDFDQIPNTQSCQTSSFMVACLHQVDISLGCMQET